MSNLLKIICSLAFVWVLLGALAASSPDAARSGEQMATGECTRCHSAQKLCVNLGKDQVYWKETVERMRMAHGAKIEAGETLPLITYLAGLPAGSAPLCQ